MRNFYRQLAIFFWSHCLLYMVFHLGSQFYSSLRNVGSIVLQRNPLQLSFAALSLNQKGSLNSLFNVDFEVGNVLVVVVIIAKQKSYSKLFYLKRIFFGGGGNQRKINYLTNVLNCPTLCTKMPNVWDNPILRTLYFLQLFDQRLPEVLLWPII